MHSNRFYKQYQHQQNWNHWYDLPENYQNQQVDTMISSIHTRSFPTNYMIEKIYPSLDGLGVPRFRVQKPFNYKYPLNLNNSNRLYDYIKPLPLNMRAVFIPSYSLPFQQSSAGPLALPPFTFNRMVQPLCSLPLPPPLPQVALLYLGNYVQQPCMQQYMNQIPVSPCIPNWEVYQQMPLNYPQQSIMPISTYQPYQPSIIPNTMPVLPLQIPSSPMNVTEPIQSYNNNYPSICRACVPPPPLPSFNNSVTNNSPIQYCPICYQTQNATPKPNIRLANRPITSSIRPSPGLPNLNNRIRRPEIRYPYMNSWGRKTPPIPRGAFLLSDEYITKREFSEEDRHSQIHRQPPGRHQNKTVKRIVMPRKMNTDRIDLNKTPSSSKITFADSRTGSRQSLSKTKSIASSRSTYGISFNKNINDDKTSVSTNTKSSNLSHRQQQQLPTIPDIIHAEAPVRKPSTIQDTNRHLDSSKSDELRDLRLSLAIEDTQLDQLSTVQNSSIKNNKEKETDDKTNKSIHTTISTLAPSKTTESQYSTIRETTATPSSIVKTTSYATLSSIRDRNFDTMSTISTMKTDEQTEKNLSIIES